MSVTHVAGPMIGSDKGDWYIQRCMVCGDILESGHQSRVAIVLTDAQRAANILRWAVGNLVCIDGNNRSDVGTFDQIDTLPDDFCLELVESLRG